MVLFVAWLEFRDVVFGVPLDLLSTASVPAVRQEFEWIIQYGLMHNPLVKKCFVISLFMTCVDDLTIFQSHPVLQVERYPISEIVIAMPVPGLLAQQAKLRKYKVIFKVKSRVKTWQVRGISS